jgi:phosphoribosyl 1,2-cyclic phosphate phosphodiesterase
LTITFLGTGTSQGVPVIGCDCGVCTSSDPADNRLRSSVHIIVEDKSIVIDTGPDFRQQMLREKIRFLDAVLFTHPHKDHIAGMDDIRSFNFLLKKAIPVYANKITREQLISEFPYVFEPNGYGGAPRILLNEISDEPFYFEGLQIIPVRVLHDKLVVLGYRIGGFSYITDANFISEASLDKIYGTKILVLNALQENPHPSHFNLDQALNEIERIKPKKAFLTHISHNMGLHASVSKNLPDNVYLAFDGLKLNL